MSCKIHYLSQSRLQKWLLLLYFDILSTTFLPLTHADLGTAARYSTPYLPTACYDRDATAFPANNLFAAAGEGIWDNGAACGRQYLVTCISAPAPNSCIPGSTIQVKIVDRASSTVSHPSSSGAALVLSTTAFSQLVNPPSATSINILFRQESYEDMENKQEGTGNNKLELDFMSPP